VTVTLKVLKVAAGEVSGAAASSKPFVTMSEETCA
jgi:hypothetical protein